ncbi:MAG: hypothetical protein ACREL7_16555 [Longimicrobiales bacterium]
MKRMVRGPIVPALFIVLFGLTACDSPTGPIAPETGDQRMIDLAYTLGLSSSAIGSNYTINVNGTLYDVGCPMQCWLPQGVVTLLEQMVATGRLYIIWSSPPSAYVPGTKTPVILQNGRSAPICANGRDDDGDGLIDWPSDPGCASAIDDNEFNSPPAALCSNGLDDDGDGQIDYPSDPGCDDPNDNDEFDSPLPVCSNGLDDDGDGFIDYPADPGCDDANDNNEFNTPPISAKTPPVITAPPFIHGQIPFKGMKQWTLTCPVRATLTSTDQRTWTALGLIVHIDYVKYVRGSGWITTDTDTFTWLDDAATGTAVLGAGWPHTLRLANHEAKIRVTMRVLGSDGEDILVDVNDGALIFCAL